METIYRVKHIDEIAKYWGERADKAAEEVNGLKSKSKRKVAEERARILGEVADMLGKTIIEP